MTIFASLAPGDDALAVEVNDLYVAVIPVADRSDGVLRQVTAVGLQSVLVKVTGLTREQVGQRLQDAPVLAREAMLRYRYLDLGDGRVAASLVYDPRSVESIVARFGLPFWGSQRPLTLLWLVVDDGVRRIVGADDLEFSQVLSRRAADRGLPLLLPLMDVQDLQAVPPGVVWSQDFPALRRASERYAARLVATAYLRRDVGAGWRASWVLERDGRADSGNLTAEGVAQAAAGVVDAIADNLFAEYARQPLQVQVPNKAAQITVSGIRHIEQYRAVWRYLDGLDGASLVRPKHLLGDTVRFDVQFAGDLVELRKQILLGRTLVAVAQPLEGSVAPVPDTNQGFFFALVPQP